MVSVSGVVRGIGQLVKINTPRSQEENRLWGRPGGQTDRHRTCPALHPSCLNQSLQLDHTSASQGKGGGEAGVSVGPGQRDPAWSGSLRFGSWLPPSEEVILVQEPRRRQGLPGREDVECAGRVVQGRGRSPGQHSQRLSERGLPCLKSRWTEGQRGTLSSFSLLPGHPSFFSRSFGMPF